MFKKIIYTDGAENQLVCHKSGIKTYIDQKSLNDFLPN